MGGFQSDKQGLRVLFAGAGLQLFLGILYVWSVFVKPVSDYYNWNETDVKLTASFMLCFFVIGILLGGKLQVRLGVKTVTLTGGLVVAASMLVTAFIPGNANVALIYVFYGVFGGFGVGAAYNAILSAVQKWFPKNRGFATGVCVSAFGFSTVIFAPLVSLLVENMGVKNTFIILAIIFAAAVLLLFRFIVSPENMPNAAVPNLKGTQYSTLEMLATMRFYLIALSLMLGTSVFFIINPDLRNLAVNRGLENFATILVIFMGVSNSVGRLCTPLISDKIGREAADILILSVTAVGAFCLCFAQGVFLIVVIAAIAFCYGGYSGLYPVLTSENFGIKNIGSNYGTVMVGFMLSALLFPVFLNKIENQTAKFVVLGVFATVGALLILVLKLINAKRKDLL